MNKVFFAKASDRSYLHPDRIYANFIKPLIWEGLTCGTISKYCNVKSNTIRRFVKMYATIQDTNKLKSNFKHIRSTVPKLICRKCDSYYPLIKSYILKGYTAIETRKTLREKHDIRIGLETLRQVVKRNGEEIIVKQLYKNGSDRAKEVAIRNCTAKSSKIEETFKDIILQYFPTAKGNHPVMGSHGFSWLIDVALPEQQIAFEYDGICWHNEERDRKRDLDLVKQGWRVVRFPYGPTPKREVLEQDFLNKARELNLL